jgi:protein-S-isoprenylcysteine O-methyltransferase Ste14
MNAKDRTNGLDVGILPLALSAGGFAVSLILEWVLPIGFLPAFLSPGWQLVAGPALFAFGLYLMIWAMWTLKRAGTGFNPTDPTTAIVTDGPFRFSRNPMYVTLLFFQAGVATSFSLEWGLVLLPLVWLALDRLVVVREEAYLDALFTQTYRAYRARVRRWL